MKKIALVILALALMAAWGCAKKQTAAQTEPVAQAEPAPEPAAEEPAPVVEEPAPVVEEPAAQAAPTARELYEQRYADLPTSHTVSKGECLWWISEYQQIYNDPFMWPLIYKANRGQINNPNLIYPGQVLSIPRDGFSLSDVTSSRKMAGAPWKSLEPAETAVLPAQIRSELGYGF